MLKPTTGFSPDIAEGLSLSQAESNLRRSVHIIDPFQPKSPSVTSMQAEPLGLECECLHVGIMYSVTSTIVAVLQLLTHKRLR